MPPIRAVPPPGPITCLAILDSKQPSLEAYLTTQQAPLTSQQELGKVTKEGAISLGKAAKEYPILEAYSAIRPIPATQPIPATLPIQAASQLLVSRLTLPSQKELGINPREIYSPILQLPEITYLANSPLIPLPRPQTLPRLELGMQALLPQIYSG